MALRLYFNSRSTYSRRVRIACLEKGIEPELVHVDMAAKEHKRPDYVAMNPYSRVPTIEHDGFVLYESTAILGYLDAVWPDAPLFPDDPRQRARVEMHMKLCDLEFGSPAGVIIFPKRFLLPERWDVQAFAAASAAIERHLDIVAQDLNGREFLVGDRLTAADLVYLPLLHFLPLMDAAVPPAIAAWGERLLSRPSAVATIPER